MRLGKRRKNLLSDKKGNVLALTAAAMPLLVGAAGLAIDTIGLSMARRELQRAADSAALAGAYAKVQEKNINAAVTHSLDFNDAYPLIGNPAISEPRQGVHANRSVLVGLSATRSAPFWSFFGTPPQINVNATAALVYIGKYCMVSLDEGTGTGIKFSGTSDIKLRCGVIANGSGESAVTAEGNTKVEASPVAAVGGVPSNASAYATGTLLLPNSLKQDDPFSDLPPPEPSGCVAGPSVRNGETQTIEPGCYRGMDVNGTLKLNPGTYYITDSGRNGGDDFRINANATLIGDDVTLIFTSETPDDQNSFPSMSINGTALVKLNAPPPGADFEGLLMYYDRRAKAASHHINGASGSNFEGAMYFPSHDLTFNGGAEMTTHCIQIVAKHVTFSGNLTIVNTCDTGGSKKFDAKWVRLVA